jgi:hypothetical protein
MTRIWSGQVIAKVDMLMALVAALVVMIAEPQPQAQAAMDKSICQLAVDIEWGKGLPVDVDLWVQAPGDTPVGYSAKDGHVFNLVRDDLGITYAADEVNSERACARFTPDGDYAVNVHLYSHSSSPPIGVVVTVSNVDVSAATMTTLITKTVKLDFKGQELTVVRWKMKDGKVVSGSENDIPIKLRSKKK